MGHAVRILLPLLRTLMAPGQASSPISPHIELMHLGIATFRQPAIALSQGDCRMHKWLNYPFDVLCFGAKLALLVE